MTQYTVFLRPKDLPFTKYAVRAFYIIKDRTEPVPEKEWWALAQTDEELYDLRDRLAEMGLTCIPRYPADDPAIVEVWI